MANARTERPSLLWPGILVGIGLAGTLDEVVLHQLLAWHHFYDRSTPTIGLVSDGLFHLFSTVVLVIGLIQLVERRRTTPEPPHVALAGILLGAGGFNPYDLAFLTIAAAAVLAGALLLRHARQPTP